MDCSTIGLVKFLPLTRIKKNCIQIIRFYILSFLFGIIYVSETKAGTKDSVYAYILACDIKHPEIVLKQAILETGWFTSKFLMKRNNLFAFRSTKKYMHFDSWQASVEYYKRWQDDRYKNPKENYYKFLVRIKYARTIEYIKELKRISLKRSEGSLK